MTGPAAGRNNPSASHQGSEFLITPKPEWDRAHGNPGTLRHKSATTTARSLHSLRGMAGARQGLEDTPGEKGIAIKMPATANASRVKMKPSDLHIVLHTQLAQLLKFGVPSG